MRLFVGIPLPAAVSEEVLALSLRLQSPGDGLRWSAPESWHVTLQFLGNTGPEKYDCIAARLRELRQEQFSITIGETGFFDRVGIFFAGVDLTPELNGLHLAVTGATAKCGFVPETRPYHPHITLARAKNGKSGLQALAHLKARLRRQPARWSFVAESFLLYESFTLPSGSRYQVRERFPLRGERTAEPSTVSSLS
jgi:2'-5' RNA ligase